MRSCLLLKRPSISYCLTLAIAFATLSNATAEDTLPETIDYGKHIRPIFTQNCTSCHGGVKQAAELSFVYPDQLADILEPGSPDDSYLLERITDEDDESRMPPPEHGPRLSESDVALLRKWIEQGAQWGAHWAYQQPRKNASLAAPLNLNWERQPLDRFVLSRLQAEKIQPAEDERPERWLRRVTLDLVGLPPSLDDRDEFLADLQSRGEAAYETVVDRLLASPQFGERWATPWLDLVRYADSRGSSEDSRRDIWKYRDWLIDALNQDMPYDQFTIKQIAGDLLSERSIEDHLATAVHRLTHSNEEGGTDDEEFRVAAVLDRVTTTWQTWLGTSIGCVQCHDHPYDPFKHEEFYEFMAFFNNTADCDLTDDWPHVDVPRDRSEYAKASELDSEISTLKEKLWQDRWEVAQNQTHWEKLRIAKVKSSNATRLVVDSKPTHDAYRTTGTLAASPWIVAELTVPEQHEHVTGIRITALPFDADAALASPEVGFVMSQLQVQLKMPGKNKPVPVKIGRLIADEPFPYSDPEESLKESKEGYGAYTRMHHPRHLIIVPEEPLQVPAGSKLVVRSFYRIHDLAAFALVARSGYYSISSDPGLTELATNESHEQLDKQLAELEEARSKIDSVAMPVLKQRPEHLTRNSHQFIRGLFLTKGKQVFPDVPESLKPEGQELSDRMALANWLVGGQNPLTARVAVNRYWARMFGVGLVATEEDFGAAGDPPSHPELLDDMALRFQGEYQWSVKRLLREIALSRTYRQSSRIRPEIHEVDPRNRLLARGPRHSLPAETLRDQLLSLSGLLSLKMYGEPVYPPLPSGVWRARRGVWRTAKVGDENRYRRSLYTFVKRSVPFPMFTTFDAPSRDQCNPRRQRSNTPLQSLTLLNDKTFVECAEAYAESINKSPGELKDKIADGFLRATLREPTSEELAPLLSLYEEVEQSSDGQVAMQAVAGVLLNLDEVIMK